MEQLNSATSGPPGPLSRAPPRLQGGKLPIGQVVPDPAGQQPSMGGRMGGIQDRKVGSRGQQGHHGGPVLRGQAGGTGPTGAGRAE